MAIRVCVQLLSISRGCGFDLCVALDEATQSRACTWTCLDLWACGGVHGPGENKLLVIQKKMVNRIWPVTVVSNDFGFFIV